MPDGLNSVRRTVLDLVAAALFQQQLNIDDKAVDMEAVYRECCLQTVETLCCNAVFERKPESTLALGIS